MLQAQRLPDLADEVRHLLGYEPVFGDLAGAPDLVAAVMPWVRQLRQAGAARTLADLPPQAAGA